MYDLVRGPLVYIAFAVFVLGVVYQTVRFYSLSQPHKRMTLASIKPTPAPKRFSAQWWQCWATWFRKSVLTVNPVMVVVTTVFHICLILVPLLVLGHNVLLDISFGISLPSLSESTADFLTLVFLAGAAFFLFRRMFVPRVRAITSAYDYLIWLITAAPFITGALAYRQIFDYDTMILLHMLSGEIMLMAIPFTKLVHALFYFLNRFVLVHEHTMGSGSRVWR